MVQQLMMCTKGNKYSSKEININVHSQKAIQQRFRTELALDQLF